jgi:hypothetical protein
LLGGFPTGWSGSTFPLAAGLPTADQEIRAASDRARHRDEQWIARWLTVELGQLAVLHAGVTGKR